MKTNKELLAQLFELFEQFEKAGIDTKEICNIEMYNGIIDISIDRDIMIEHYDKFIELGFQDSKPWEEHGDMYKDNIEIYLG